MGTRGYWFYHHKGWYYVYFSRLDSYPQGLGIQVASQIPVGDPENYQNWLKALRESLDKDLETAKEKGILENKDINPMYTQTAPTNDLWIEWMYELDLDREIFLVDSHPLFDLRNMPSTPELFVECIGFDSYGHRACSASTPIQHIYNWMSPPPTVEDGAIQRFLTIGERSELPFEKLLSITGVGPIEKCEAVHIAFYEVIVGQMMRDWEVHHFLRVLESFPDRSHLSADHISIGMNMVNATVGGNRFDVQTTGADYDLMWLSANICLHISTHLDDERNRKKNIIELVDAVVHHQREYPGDKYGILFSFFHCIIVKVNATGGFKCTTPLRFLPSFYASSPSTPGITAIARLAYHCSDLALDKSHATNSLPSDHVLNRVPEDVWRTVAENLGSRDLHNLLSINLPLLRPVVRSILRYPHLGDHRLTGVIRRIDGSETWVPDSDSSTPNPVLISHTFSTVIQGSSGPTLTLGIRNNYTHCHLIPIRNDATGPHAIYYTIGSK
ncbi:hypothetical protein DFH07DRAFT_896622 [Mycena maculata]|uniref:F-box domain-containing protein n=1 Tax=Mycena maculata TaxID=230809 RepID=A0AAD7HR30_9AGAR|nr:hypothetical protein DFH07DRAFT_896622 [Mycena maculata]